MKGSAITGPVGKEAAELWPVRRDLLLLYPEERTDKLSAYCQQLRCRHVKGFFLLGVMAWKWFCCCMVHTEIAMTTK